MMPLQLGPESVPAWLPYVNSFGLVLISLFLVTAFIRRMVVTKGELDDKEAQCVEARSDLEDMRRDRDDWKAIAQRGTNQAETSTKNLIDLVHVIRALEGNHRPRA
jgi:hypothetical protein